MLLFVFSINMVQSWDGLGLWSPIGFAIDLAQIVSLKKLAKQRKCCLRLAYLTENNLVLNLI